MWKGISSICYIVSKALIKYLWKNSRISFQMHNKKALMRKKDVWYSLTRDVMIDYLYNVSPLSSLLMFDFCINITSILGRSQLVTSRFLFTTRGIWCWWHNNTSIFWKSKQGGWFIKVGVRSTHGKGNWRQTKDLWNKLREDGMCGGPNSKSWIPQGDI